MKRTANRKFPPFLAGGALFFVGGLCGLMLGGRDGSKTLDSPPEPEAQWQASAAPDRGIPRSNGRLARRLRGVNEVAASARSAPRDTLEKIFRTVNDNGARLEMLQHLFSVWAEHDDGEALEAALGLRQQNYVFACVEAVLVSMAGRDPMRALETANNLPIGANRISSLGTSIFEEWARLAPSDALQALTKVSGGRRADAVSGFVSGLSIRDPISAYKIASESDIDEVRNLRFNPISILARRDFKTAYAFALDLPDEDRFQALTSILPTWGYMDAEGATTWINANLSGSRKKRMLSRVRSAGEIGPGDLQSGTGN